MMYCKSTKNANRSTSYCNDFGGHILKSVFTRPLSNSNVNVFNGNQIYHLPNTVNFVDIQHFQTQTIQKRNLFAMTFNKIVTDTWIVSQSTLNTGKQNATHI